MPEWRQRSCCLALADAEHARWTAALAEHIALLPPPAARPTKESPNIGMRIPQPDAALADLYRFAILEMTEDKAGSHAAGRDRRRPRFTGL